jgi:hypothetical protein
MKKAKAKAGSRAATQPPARSPKAPAARDAVSTEEIGRRAYDLYLLRGRAEGSALEDWLQAERELLHK